MTPRLDTRGRRVGRTVRNYQSWCHDLDWTWRDQAACAGADPDLFVPGLPGQPIPTRAREAAAMFCAHCPVTAECAADAEANRHIGLWGGRWCTDTRGYRQNPLVETEVA